MSLATRCPHCNTIFKVVQDQLKVSEGWVRCGRCHEVFNALEGLFDMEREAPPRRAPAPAPAAASSSISDQAPGSGVAPPAQPQPATATALQAPVPGDTFDGGLAAMAGPGPDSTFAPTHPADADIAPPSRGLAEAAPTPGVTQFDLDMPPSDEAVAAALSALTDHPVPTASFDDLPQTDEADALESRYLLPQDERRTPRRRSREVADFADAEFPADMIEDTPEWEAGWTAPAEEPPAPRDEGPATLPPANALLRTPAVEASSLATPEGDDAAAFDLAGSPEASLPVAEPARAPDTPAPPAAKGDYQPEQAVLPPSQRPPKKAAEETPAFIRQAERKALWRNPTVRGLLAGLALALLLLLGAQAAHQQRDRLAADVPALAPWLQRWCDWAGCRLSPPRRLDALQVDSITLVKATSEGPDTYRLTTIIHNRAASPLAWPQLDVTLTGADGAVLVRRIFEAGTAAAVSTEGGLAPVPPSVPPDGNITLRWRLRAPGLPLAGYTVELFYP